MNSTSERAKQMLYIDAYVWNLEKQYRWTYLQSRNRDIDIENKHMDTKGEGWEGWIGRWGLSYIYMSLSIYITLCYAVLCLVTQSCPTLCDPMDCSPPSSSVHAGLQARILEWLPCPPPGIFPTEGSNPGLLHCRQILYHLSHQGSPCIYK